MNLSSDVDTSLWFVSSRPADRRVIFQGTLVVLVSTLVFFIALPFVRLPGPHAPSFLPFDVASLMFCDFTTVILLLGHFAVLRLGSLLVLAAGYLFTGLMTLGYTVVFPNLFFPPELSGSGTQDSLFLSSGIPSSRTGKPCLWLTAAEERGVRGPQGKSGDFSQPLRSPPVDGRPCRHWETN